MVPTTIQYAAGMASPPDMHPVDSSAIAAVGYDAAARELYVRFIDGETYIYEAVPERVFDDLLEAESKGRFVNLHVKPAYDVRRA